jgi:uncharacterized protein (TIGR02594 family)
MLRMKTSGALWDCSVNPAKPLRFVGPEIPLEEVSRSANNLWIHVNAFFPLSAEPLKCCVIAADVVVDESGPKPLEIWSFLKYCTLAAVTLNQEMKAKEFGVNRDYLIALACVLSDLKNVPSGDPTSDAFGPFQLTKTEWTDFRMRGDNKADFSDLDRLDPLYQVDAAALFAFEATSDLSKALTDPATGGGPYVPDSIDLFLAHMIGATAAIEALKADRAGQGTKPLADIITAAGGNLADLKKRYPRFLNVEGSTTIDQVQAIIEREFDTALERAFTLIRDNTPEDLPKVTAGAGAAPWLTIARQEEAQGIAEPNPRILKYFESIKFNGATPTTHWCGAFVGFCLNQSGNPSAAASVPSTGAALAATWKGWGSQISTHATDIPEGAIVVLSAVESDTSGHVAFFIRSNVTSVTLLGGNQSNRVKESTFPRNRVVHVGWLDVGGPGGGGPASPGTFDLSIVPSSRKAIAKLIIDEFKAAGFGAVQQATALANAIAESNLNPDAHNTVGEDSVGLFQLNRNGGLGTGHSVDKLKDPKTNIGIIIKEAKKFPAFGTATTLDVAVTVFVRKVERPANPADAIVKRLKLAQQILK